MNSFIYYFSISQEGSSRHCGSLHGIADGENDDLCLKNQQVQHNIIKF